MCTNVNLRDDIIPKGSIADGGNDWRKHYNGRPHGTTNIKGPSLEEPSALKLGRAQNDVGSGNVA
jgi:hypothetical protein